MDWGKAKFFLGEVARNFTRNAGMQATAIGTVAVTIALLGVFLYVRSSVAHLGSTVMSQIEVSAYMTPQATAAQEDAVRTALAEDPRVLSSAFVPKAEGLREMRSRLKGEIDTSLLDENPLPDMFRIRARRAQDVPAIAKMVRKLPAVQEADYQQQIVQRLLQLAAVARRVGIALIAVFVLVAGIIISNTIRLTVFARRREISIMQLVGATNTYIRMPFICEGMLAGVIGALLALGVLAIGRASLMPKLVAALPWLQINAVPIDGTAFALQLVAVGGAVGIVASWFAVGRYLRT